MTTAALWLICLGCPGGLLLLLVVFLWRYKVVIIDGIDELQRDE